MSLTRNLILIFLFLAVGTAYARDYTGLYKGDGRACYGSLFIRQKSIQWNSSFVKCQSTPYDILSSSDGEKPETIFITKNNNTCIFSVIDLYSIPGDHGIWTVVGYKSLEDYKQKKDNFYLACRMEKVEKKR